MKNRKREICTSGSVRDEDGQPPHLLGRRRFLHLAAGAAGLHCLASAAFCRNLSARNDIQGKHWNNDPVPQMHRTTRKPPRWSVGRDPAPHSWAAMASPDP
jgi:hypothetical protein